MPTDLAANPSEGDLVSVVSGAFAYVAPSGLVVVDSLLEGLGIVVDMPTGNVTVSLEAQFQGRNLGTVTDPQAVLTLGTYAIRLELDYVPTAAADYGVGDTFTFHIPDPITDVGNDNTPLSLLPATSGSFIDIVSPLDGSVLIRSDLVPGALHTVRLNHEGNWALVSPEIAIVRSLTEGIGIDLTSVAGNTNIAVEAQYRGRQLADGFPAFVLSLAQYVVDLDIPAAPGTGYAAGDTLTFVVPDPITNVGTATTPLSVRVNTGGELYFVVSAADRSRLTRSDLVPGGLHTVRFNQANEFALVEPSTIGDSGDGVVDTLGLAFANQILEITLGRSIGADIVQTVTLPESGGTGRFFGVPRANVGGSATAITLTTGRSLAGLQHGDSFFWHAIHNTNASATVEIDGLNARDIRRSDGQGGGSQLSGGEITDDDPVLIYYDSHLGHFFLGVARAGDAAQRNVGTAQHEVPVLGSGGSLANAIVTATGLALLASPAFTGSPTAPTPAVGDNSTFIATTEFVLANSGAGGFALRFGTGNPADSLGGDDDWYLNTTAGSWHEKVAGAWEHRYTDQIGAGGGLTQDQVDARVDLLALLEANNLSDLDDVAAARTNLEVLNEAEVDARAALRFTDAQVAKLAGIEAGATEDQSDSELKIGYEANADTNAFTDALLAKLNGIMANAAPADGVVDDITYSVAGQVLTTTLSRSIGVDVIGTVTLPSQGFDLHDDVANYVGLNAVNLLDRMLLSDESVNGDPNRYALVSDILSELYNMPQLGGTLADNDRIFFGDVSATDNRIKYLHFSDFRTALGPLGFTFRHGPANPPDSLGADGDWYLQTTAGIWLEKVSGTWQVRYTDQVGAGGGLTEAQVDARVDLLSLRKAQNLADLANAATARTNLGVLTEGEVDVRVQTIANAPYVRGLLNLTATQADRIVVGGSFSGRALALSRNNTGNQNIQFPILTADEAIDSTHTGWSLINGQIFVGAVDALALRQAQNLADLDNVATARTNLGVLNQGQVDARVTHVASDAFHSASFSNLSRRLTFGRLGGGTSSVPLNFLNSYAGADPPTNLEYEGGDTVQVNGELYFYTGTLATIATSAIPTHTHFINLTEGGLQTVATGVGLAGDGSVSDPLHIPNDGIVTGMYSPNSIGTGVLRSATVTRQNLIANNVPSSVRTTLGYDMADSQFTWKAVAELTGATFTGDVFGVSAPDADDSLRFATTEWVRAHNVSSLPTGTGRYYRIINANVAGGANNIQLTTGESISSLSNGDLFFFRSNHSPTGTTMVTIDGLDAVSLRRSNGSGGSEEFQGGEFNADAPVLMVYDAQADHLFLGAARVGTAASYNVGTLEGEVPVIGAGDVLSEDLIPDRHQSSYFVIP